MKRKTKAQRARRIKEKTAKNAAAREAGEAAADEAQERPKIARDQPILERYRVRGQITEVQYEAGERLHEAAVGMGQSFVKAASYERVSPSNGDPTPRQIKCYHDYVSAIQAVGQFLSPVLISVCIHDQSCAEWASTYHRKETDGIGILRLALDALAHHYGLSRYELPNLRLPQTAIDIPAKPVLVGETRLP
jgi:Domain of unknown function (DUF6456)